MDYEKEIALYYPHIDINDVNLVKTTALYWDEIQTIVPEDEIEKGHNIYNTEISIEAKKEKFIKYRTVNPLDGVLIQTGSEIVDDLERTPQMLDKLAKAVRDSIRSRKRDNPPFSKIHIEKFSTLEFLRLKNILDKANIIISPQDNKCDWIIVPTPFYDMYMSRLASVIAAKDRTDPLTNETLWQDVIIDRYKDYSEELKLNRSQLAELSLKTISIAPDVFLAEVIKFRNNHRDMLINFKSYIHELSWQVAKGLNAPERQYVFEEIINYKILPASKELEAKLNENNLHFVAGNFLLTLVGCAEIVITQEWLGPLLTNGILAAAGWIGNLREERIIHKKHPLSYLYQAQKALG